MMRDPVQPWQGDFGLGRLGRLSGEPVSPKVGDYRGRPPFGEAPG